MLPAKGFIFLCSDATEDECLKKKLLGGRLLYHKYVRDLKKGDTLYLYNYNSKKLHGPFIATSGVQEDLVPTAWGGQYPVQVKFKAAKKYLPLHREHLTTLLKFNRVGFPSAKVTEAQMLKLQTMFAAKRRHATYDDSAALPTHDGHKVRSEPERKIDDWLFEHHVAHAYEYPIPETKRCDFYLPTLDVYIEYWGLKDSKYELNKALKKKIYKRHNLRLLELTPHSLKTLDTVLSKALDLKI